MKETIYHGDAASCVWSFAASKGFPYCCPSLPCRIAKDNQTIMLPHRNWLEQVPENEIRYFGWNGNSFVMAEFIITEG